MDTPYLVQRCMLGESRLKYDYMGSSEFEWGDQARKLKEMFTQGLATRVVTVSAYAKDIPVYMVAAEGFDFSEYQPYLQLMAHDELRNLKEWTYFDHAARRAAGVEVEQRGYKAETNAWFDFVNGVLWTLSEEDHQRLVRVLQDIKKLWAEKAA